ncbi:MAG: DUF169 domain-containing protein [Pseudomonadota bacterium]|uniref:DUF169 domain-containing protein n=1 Tax=Candidatus Desulfatibia profunda TaxID=2841695 RepID=A0A8J6NSY1_9BACT|nr:DUF169 domain-containing protein [Candidatus Desulfatibia profunda]
MTHQNYQETAETIRNDLRLKTLPVAVKFLKNKTDFPEKTRQPSAVLGKRVTICQGVTMARNYGWTVGLAREDLICVPAMIVFGFSGAADPAETLGKLFCEVDFAQNEQKGAAEIEAMVRLENNEYEAVVLAPLQKGLFDPDTIAFYGNPAQVMRLVQALVYQTGRRIKGNFGGKVECSEYLIAPYKTRAPRIAMPGMGDRIFSMTQDDEMVFSIPGMLLEELAQGLKAAGKKIGARYPVTFYQNFEPEFPKPYKKLAEELGLF